MTRRPRITSRWRHRHARRPSWLEDASARKSQVLIWFQRDLHRFPSYQSISFQWPSCSCPVSIHQLERLTGLRNCQWTPCLLILLSDSLHDSIFWRRYWHRYSSSVQLIIGRVLLHTRFQLITNLVIQLSPLILPNRDHKRFKLVWSTLFYDSDLLDSSFTWKSIDVWAKNLVSLQTLTHNSQNYDFFAIFSFMITCTFSIRSSVSNFLTKFSCNDLDSSIESRTAWSKTVTITDIRLARGIIHVWILQSITTYSGRNTFSHFVTQDRDSDPLTFNRNEPLTRRRRNQNSTPINSSSPWDSFVQGSPTRSDWVWLFILTTNPFQYW